MKPFLSAVVSVDRAGENSAAWWNATMSAGVHELPMAGLAEAAKRSVIWWSSWIWSAHRPCGVAWQVMDCPVGHLMVHVVPSKWTLHPAWVSGVTPMRFVPRSGNTWTVLAPSGMPGSGRSAVCVDCMSCWLATLTVIGLLVGWRLGRLLLAEK
jgi:hypothetical protein